MKSLMTVIKYLYKPLLRILTIYEIQEVNRFMGAGAMLVLLMDLNIEMIEIFH